MKINYIELEKELLNEYSKKFPLSEKLQARAKNTLIDGGSHSIRLIEPFPPRITAAEGAYIKTEEGVSLLDFWQGHHANILGHNPEEIVRPLSQMTSSRKGLQTGFTDKLQIETAELLCGALDADMCRFTTSGSLATMYAVILSRAYTGRSLVMKVGGGWHGAQPWGLKGIDFHGKDDVFNLVDTEGLPAAFCDEVVVTRFNDTQMLKEMFSRYGNSLACFILEPFIGAGGFLFSSKEFIQTARELTKKYGVLLIFDEVISGFRFCPGTIGTLYGVKPDLGTYGKIVGGGMPLSAVAGRKEVMKLAGRSGNKAVRFSGGTYSAHPAALKAASAMMKHCIENKDTLYPQIGQLGRKARGIIRAVFSGSGFPVDVTGDISGELDSKTGFGSSMGMVFFPKEGDQKIKTPEEGRDPGIVDPILGEKLLQLALLIEGVHVVHGFGSVTAAHTEQDLETFQFACTNTARRFSRFAE